MNINMRIKRWIEKHFEVKRFSWEKWFQEYETEIIMLFGLLGFYLSGGLAIGLILFAFIPVIIHQFWNLYHYKEKYLSKLFPIDKPAKKFGDGLEKSMDKITTTIDKHGKGFGKWLDNILGEKKK